MGTETAAQTAAKPALVKARGLNKRYIQRAPFSHKKFVIDALVDVDFEVPRAGFTALIGGSGCGKSTLASCLAMLEMPDRGEIWFEGNEISGHASRELESFRSRVQMLFQDSAGALNPRLSAGQIIAEPLEIQRKQSGERLRRRVCELMEEVGLSPDWAHQRPLEFSGGQRQRVAIARALAVQPTFLILDESLSGLDLSTQAQILNLLMDLQSTHSLTCLLISHDLSLVGQIADSVAVMHGGRIVEQGTRQQVLGNPLHDHTRELLASFRLLDTGFRAAHAGGHR